MYKSSLLLIMTIGSISSFASTIQKNTVFHIAGKPDLTMTIDVPTEIRLNEIKFDSVIGRENQDFTVTCNDNFRYTTDEKVTLKTNVSTLNGPLRQISLSGKSEQKRTISNAELCNDYDIISEKTAFIGVSNEIPLTQNVFVKIESKGIMNPTSKTVTIESYKVFWRTDGTPYTLLP